MERCCETVMPPNEVMHVYNNPFPVVTAKVFSKELSHENRFLKAANSLYMTTHDYIIIPNNWQTQITDFLATKVIESSKQASSYAMILSSLQRRFQDKLIKPVSSSMKPTEWMEAIRTKRALCGQSINFCYTSSKGWITENFQTIRDGYNTFRR